MQAASCGSASELYRQSGASKALLCSDLAILRHNIRLSLLHCVRQHFDVVSCCFQDFAAWRVAMCTMWRPKISTPCRHWLAVLPANSWLVIRTRWLCSLPPNCGLPHASQGPLIHTACRPHRGREVPPAGRGQSAAGGQALTRAPRAAAHSCSGSRWSPGNRNDSVRKWGYDCGFIAVSQDSSAHPENDVVNPHFPNKDCVAGHQL